MIMHGFAEFILLNPASAGYSLNGYTDINGNVKQVLDRKGSNGEPIARRFKFTYNNRVIRIPNAQKEIIEFLRNAPECVGSPNNTGHHCYYKEVNTAADAEKVVENEIKRLEAMNAAVALNGSELAQIAILCGSMDPNPGIQKHKVLTYAGSSPVLFMELLNSPDVKSRSLIRKAVESGVIKKKGFIYMWEDVHLGNDEDSAVQTLMKDKKIIDAIEKAVKKT